MLRYTVTTTNLHNIKHLHGKRQETTYFWGYNTIVEPR